MSICWRRFAVLLAFLALPLQGMAAAVHALHCVPGGDEHHAAHTQDHGHAHTPAAHGAPNDHEGDAASHDAAHFCCNLFSSGLLTTTITPARTEEPDFIATLSPFATLFIPERPQRPPRS